MTSGDGLLPDGTRPWWVEYDHAPDEQAFVHAVSGALFVPDAAPEIRMIAEVMASMSIPEWAMPQVAEDIAPVVSLDEHRRRRGFGQIFGAGSAAAVALVALTVSAYAGVLPSSVQDVAHNVINAPKPHKNTPGGHGNGDNSGNSGQHNGGNGSPVGPNPNGPAAYGLCTAYAQASAHGNATDKSVAFGKLVAAAGGAQNVAAFCADVTPGNPSAGSTIVPPGSDQGGGRPTVAGSPQGGNGGNGGGSGTPSTGGTGNNGHNGNGKGKGQAPPSAAPSSASIVGNQPPPPGKHHTP